MPTALLQRYCLSLLGAARMWRRLADRVAKDHDLSEATAYPLILIDRLGGGLRQSTLAEAMGIEGPSLVRLLDQLCAGDLVVRREDATDRRAKTLHLTERGAALATQLGRDLDRLRAEVFGAVSAEDLAAGLRVFDVLEREARRLPAADAQDPA